MDALYIAAGAAAVIYLVATRRKKQKVEVRQIAYDREKNLIAVAVRNNTKKPLNLKASVRAKFEKLATPMQDGTIALAPAQAGGRNMFTLVAEDDAPRTIEPRSNATFTFTPLQTPEEIATSSNFSVNFNYLDFSKIAAVIDTKEVEKKIDTKIEQLQKKIEEPKVPDLITEPSNPAITKPTPFETPIDLLTDIEILETLPINRPIDLLIEPVEQETDLLHEPKRPIKRSPCTVLPPNTAGRYLIHREAMLNALDRLDKIKRKNKKHFNILGTGDVAI